jgi:mannuronan 5-epimerase
VSHLGVLVSVFVFVTSTLALTALLLSQYIVFNVLPLSVQDAGAIRNKSSSTASHTPPTSNEGNTIIPSSSSQSTTSVHPVSKVGCITYNTSTRTISVSCSSARLTDIDNKIHDSGVLAKQSPSGVWFLSANLVIAKKATFHIDSIDTKWLKINSKVESNVTKLPPSYIIDVFGSLKIDSVKITSWDPRTNYYAITNGSRTGDITHLGAPRPSIIVENNATGTTDITNSEIAYLGYEQGQHKGGSGLSYYYGGDGSIIRNNDIHHVYFGLYTFGVGHMIIENNLIRNSGHYGLDPHTGTHDMIIRNNEVYDNKGGSGIICSLNCYNILIENNQVHDNAGDGIDFSRNMFNSIVRNNIVYNEPTGIIVSQSHNNQIYNNTISKSGTGINVNSGSTNNKIQGNTITDSINNAILVNNDSSGNTFSSNKIVSPTPQGLKIEQDGTSKNNVFSSNQIVGARGASNPVISGLLK